MVLRKITIDNSVKYVPITEKDIKQNTTKNKKIQLISGGGKQNKKFYKKIKKFLKNVAASGFGYITKQYLYKHKNNYIAIRIRIR